MKHTIKISLFNSAAPCRPIRLRVSFGGVRVDLFAGISYDADKWIPETARPKPNTKNQFRQSAAEVNRVLNEQTAFVDSYFDECEFKNQTPSPVELKRRFTRRFRRHIKTDESLTELYDEFLVQQSEKKSWSDNTRAVYATMRGKIAQLNCIDAQSLDELMVDLMSTGHNNATTEFYIKRILTFARWLKKNEHSDFDPAKYEIDIKTMDEHQVLYLEHDELTNLMECEITDSGVATVRDVFCFCCFCGLRHSDVKKLRKADIRNGCINIVTLKTHAPLAIELNQYTRAVLERYAEHDDVLALPVDRLTVYNKKLQTACKLAGIDAPTTKTFYIGSRRVDVERPKYECITSHAARRTFVVECLTRGIPSEVIIQWTGHKDFDAMKPYFAITNATKRNAMAKFDTGNGD